MCATCGCGLPHDNHGDSRNITIDDLRAAANAANTTLGCVAHNAESMVMHQFAQKGAEPVNMTGTVIKADDAKRFLLLVAYSANKMPHRGADGYVDIASPDVLEKACWRFAAHGMKTGLWHEEGHADEAFVTENYIYRNPVPWVIKGEDGSEQVIKEGDWVVGMILSPAAWELYKKGLIGGSSPQGGCRRGEPTPETLSRMGS